MEQPGELLSVKEVAQLLGIGQQAAGNRIRRGRIPWVARLGRRLFVRRRVLEDWLRGKIA